MCVMRFKVEVNQQGLPKQRAGHRLGWPAHDSLDKPVDRPLA